MTRCKELNKPRMDTDEVKRMKPRMSRDKHESYIKEYHVGQGRLRRISLVLANLKPVLPEKRVRFAATGQEFALKLSEAHTSGFALH